MPGMNFWWVRGEFYRFREESKEGRFLGSVRLEDLVNSCCEETESGGGLCEAEAVQGDVSQPGGRSCTYR